MPAGNAWRSLPFGPCTSTAPSTHLDGDALRNRDRFLTDSRHVLILVGFSSGLRLPAELEPELELLPDVAEHFAADAGLDGFAAGHHAARRRQDAGAEPRQHFRHVVAAEVDAAAGTADALDAGDELLAVRAVLQEQPQRLDRRRRLAGRRRRAA